ncbi:MAG: hypothetical protein WCG35_11080 [Betaproteobacteria bacterium]
MEDYFCLSHKNSAKYPLPEMRIFYNQLAAQGLEDLNGLPLEVRIWVDLLADEIEKKFHTTKTENSSPT